MKRISIPFLLALLIGAPCLRAEPAPGDNALIRIEEGKVYRVVNGEGITGREVLDITVEEAWEENLPLFIDYAIRQEEVKKAKIEVPNEQVIEELMLVLKTKGRNFVSLEDIEKNMGGGVLDFLKRSVKADLGLLKIFQQEKKLKPDVHTSSTLFEKLKHDLLEKRAQALGVTTNPKELGNGEALRIGPISYSRDEVRTFILEAVGQLPKANLIQKLDQLQLEKLVKAEAAKNNIVLGDDDRGFHFSYMCRLKESETGIPGRAIMMQLVQEKGMTPEQYTHCRVFSWDALITMVVKKNIKLKELRAAFAVNPEKFKAGENLVAHIFIQVLDPDGHPYRPNWQAPGHDAVNAYVAREREQRFQAAKTKIDGLVPLAKENFDETARKYSDDPTKKAGGLIGRLGKNTIPSPPLDKGIVEAAAKLKPGEISAPIRSDYGWHILKCLEKQDVTFDEVAERVYLVLISEARQKLYETFEATIKNSKTEDKF